MNVSGKTTSRAPLSAASASAASTFDRVPPEVSRSGAICTAATRSNACCAMPLSSTVHCAGELASHRPGVDHKGVVAAMQEDEIKHVERTDRPDAWDE